MNERVALMKAVLEIDLFKLKLLPSSESVNQSLHSDVEDISFAAFWSHLLNSYELLPAKNDF